MSETSQTLTIVKARMQAGRWDAVLLGAGDAAKAPEILVTNLEVEVEGVDLRFDADAGHWQISVPIPVHLLSDGVQTFLVQHRQTGETLASFAIAAGAPLSEDLRAEVNLLRSELDMLKRAFRRHCVETGA